MVLLFSRDVERPWTCPFHYAMLFERQLDAHDAEHCMVELGLPTFVGLEQHIHDVFPVEVEGQVVGLRYMARAGWVLRPQHVADTRHVAYEVESLPQGVDEAVVLRAARLPERKREILPAASIRDDHEGSFSPPFGLCDVWHVVPGLRVLVALARAAEVPAPFEIGPTPKEATCCALHSLQT